MAVGGYPVYDIIIPTWVAVRPAWLRTDLVDRVRGATGKPVEHVVAGHTPSPTAQEGKAA
jgi:hypothetical protein